jgi:hypothetical protein
MVFGALYAISMGFGYELFCRLIPAEACQVIYDALLKIGLLACNFGVRFMSELPLIAVTDSATCSRLLAEQIELLAKLTNLRPQAVILRAKSL